MKKDKKSQIIGFAYRLLGEALERENEDEKNMLISAARIMINSL